MNLDGKPQPGKQLAVGSLQWAVIEGWEWWISPIKWSSPWTQSSRGPILKHCLLDFIFAKQKYVHQDHSLGAGDTHTVLGDYSFCLSVELMFSTMSMCSFVLVLHYFCSQENNIAIYLKNQCLFKYRNFVIRIHISSFTGHWLPKLNLL